MNKFDPLIFNKPGTVFIDDRDLENHAGRSYLFTDPEHLITADRPEQILSALESMDRDLGLGFFLAGYIAYEAGLGLDKQIVARCRNSLPLLYFGAYRGFEEFDSERLELEGRGPEPDLANVRLSISEDEFLAGVDQIKKYISAGDIYQINFTCKLLFENEGSASGLFSRLRAAHPVCHSAFVNTGDARIISLSPELFLRREGNRVLTRPMKGTIRRGRWFDEDEKFREQLADSEKDRAENLMILDLMRNDLGRVCELGSVKAPMIFKTEQYHSLFQMTSQAQGILKPGVSASGMLRAAFPAGSITGAPKIRAMEIINELEKDARGVYCGSIGMFRPGGDCLLNVAIRTIIQQGKDCQMGIGSGIVADSSPREELRETLLKGKFIAARPVEFQLLETMLFQPGAGFGFLDAHLERMRKSARYFGWIFPEEEIKKALARLAEEIGSAPHRLTEGKARVRLLVSREGRCDVEWADAGGALNLPVSLTLAERRTDPSEVFLFHKTTRREDYDREWAVAKQAGFFDLVYLNKQGQLTEGAITNITLEIDHKWFTPALECGLLPGIWRRARIESGEVEERILGLDDLRRASRVAVGNSVRGAIEVGMINGVWQSGADGLCRK